MMIVTRSGTPDNAAMPELRSTCATLTGMTRTFLFIRFFITARNFTAGLGRSCTLATVDQLCYHNLVQDRLVWDNSKHLLTQFELFNGLSGHVIHCSRRHF